MISLEIGMNTNKLRFFRCNEAEVSANHQYVVRSADDGFRLAKCFGGRVSRSGATCWPEWLEYGAILIKPIAVLREEDLAGEEPLVAFSGGGFSKVMIYVAERAGVLKELAQWRRWRRLEPIEHPVPESDDAAPPKRSRLPEQPANDKVWISDPELSVKTDEQWIARAVSFNEIRWTDGVRLTQHEVSRYATHLVCEFDEASGAMRWTATMPCWPFSATALDNGTVRFWTLYKENICLRVRQTEDDFVETEE